jgi:inosine-uridine nucleoside N-ribohydrolase
MTTSRLVSGVLLLLTTGFIATLALPVEVWRTGRTTVAPLKLSTPDTSVPLPSRVWIDTDAACGHTPRTDVDDCLALWLIAARSELDVTGVSTVFGNGPLEVTDRITRELNALLPWPGRHDRPAVYRGFDVALTDAANPATPARDGLIRALEAGPLTIIALGPLTNIADALSVRPDLRGNVGQVVAVMGRRMGHLFHPSEGSGRGTWLGHGPVFRDFNFSMDPAAVRTLLATNVPTTLVPYDAARQVEITGDHLRRLATQDHAGAWIWAGSRGWLEYWRSDIGRSGFYPFDAMAVAHVMMPSLFRCATVNAWVGKDPMLFLPLTRPEALLVEQHNPADRGRLVRYCPDLEPSLGRQLRSWFVGDMPEPER